MRSRFLFFCLAAACDAPKPPETAGATAPTVSVEPRSAAPTTGAGPSAPVKSAEPVASAAPADAPVSSAFTWVATGSSKTGNLVLRCEDTPEHPSEVAGGCLCNSTILNPCEGEARPRHMVDRRQCMFDCNVGTNQVRLQCPDGAQPTKSPDGCACGPEKGKTLMPCGRGKPKSVDVRDKACVVTC